MTRALKISDSFSLPVDAVTQTFAIIARRGAGKTNCSVVMVEELLSADQQVVILDPLDCWWGLRADADGKAAGLSIVVIGGEHSDLPLYANSGETLADFVVESRASAVLSTRHLSKTEQRTFVATFCERLYALKGKSANKTPMHLVIDEADEVIPQKVFHGTERCVGAVDTIVRRGRSSGLGVTLISQRAAVINKDALTQTECMIALQTTSPQDRKAIEAWFEAHDVEGKHDEFMASLASLPIGTAWIWSPGWLHCFEKVKIRRRHTFDSSATPKVGEKPVVPKKLADVDIEALKSKLATTIEQKKADDPRELRKKIAELERQLREKPKAQERSKSERDVIAGHHEILGFNQASHKFVRDVLPLLDGLYENWKRDALRSMATKASPYLVVRENSLAEEEYSAAGRHDEFLAKHATSSFKYRGPVKAADGTMKPLQEPLYDTQTMTNGVWNSPHKNFGRCERAIMAALAQYPQGRNKNQAAVLAGYAVNSGGFNNALSALRQAGAIEGSGALMKITPAGLTELGDFELLPRGHDLFQYWFHKLGRCEREVLRYLWNCNGTETSKESVATGAGYAVDSGGFNNALSKLRTLELISGPGSALKASDIFYE